MPALPSLPAIEATCRTRPYLRASMCGSTALESRNSPRRGIDPPERPRHRIDRRRDAGLLRDLQRTRHGTAADLGRGRLGAFAVAVQACHPHAVARHMQGGGLADSAPGADDCDHIVRIVEVVHATCLQDLYAHLAPGRPMPERGVARGVRPCNMAGIATRGTPVP